MDIYTAVADVKTAILRVISQAQLMLGVLVYNHGFEPSRINYPLECMGLGKRAYNVISRTR